MKRKLGANDQQTMLGGAVVLTISVALVKLIGLFYKVPLANIIEEVGMGYFASAHEIYLPIFAIAITGLPIAVSRMVAQRVSTGLYRDVRAIHRVAKRLFLAMGITGTLVIAALAYPYALITAGGLLSLPAIFAIAPTVLFVCAMSAYRGYYEGLRNMVPTATSQVIEAVCKLGVGLLLAILVMRYGRHEFARYGTAFGQAVGSLDEAYSLMYPWAAAAAIMGITIGSVLGFVYLWLRHRMRGDGITQEQLTLSPPAQPKRKLAREMLVMSVPMVISASILNLTNFIDAINVQRLLHTALEVHPEVIHDIYGAVFEMRGILPDNQVSYIWGVYSIAMTFRTLIPTVVAALGISSLPVIAAAWEQKDSATIHRTVNTVIRMAMIIALPAGFGMAVLAYPILTLLYGGIPGMAQHAAPLLMVFGAFTALMAVSTPIVAILQGIGRTDVPVKSLIVGMVVKIAMNYVLVSQPHINIMGAAIATVLFFAVLVAINLTYLVRITKTKLRVNQLLVKPLFCGALCAAAAWLVNSLAARFLPQIGPDPRISLLLQVGLATGAGALIYAISMIFTKALAREDIEMLPGGKKVAKRLAKFGLIG
ncbi:MAG: polysaccharide biosynthesis protein [Oscillospiraceae bacterium]|nr:polysaccharide biosynthesis protein [Oscillospiraceae bacterium]